MENRAIIQSINTIRFQGTGLTLENAHHGNGCVEQPQIMPWNVEKCFYCQILQGEQNKLSILMAELISKYYFGKNL